MSGKTLHIAITVLCCLLTIFATLAVSGAANDEKYARKDDIREVCERVERFESENREDHKDIRLALREILKEIGRIQGRADR